MPESKKTPAFLVPVYVRAKDAAEAERLVLDRLGGVRPPIFGLGTAKGERADNE